MQVLKRPDDGIDRTGGNAEGAADTTIFINLGNLKWPFFAACRIERCRCRASEAGKLFNACCAPGGATIDGYLP